jgi:hypothetical protein
VDPHKSSGHRLKWAAVTFALFLVIGLSGRQLFQAEPWHTLWPVMAGVLALIIGLGVEHVVKQHRRQ